MVMKLYVGNIAFQTSKYDSEQLFGRSGTVNSTSTINDRDTGRACGFGFVEMAPPKEGATAITALNGKQSNGRAPLVNEARRRENNDGGNRRRGDSRW